MTLKAILDVPSTTDWYHEVHSCSEVGSGDEDDDEEEASGRKRDRRDLETWKEENDRREKSVFFQPLSHGSAM